jgi:beta-lactamase regulating signal transducer with metallopeptidase domain
MGAESVLEAMRDLPPFAAVLFRAALTGTVVLGFALLATAFAKKRPAQAHAVLFTGVLCFPLAAAISLLPAVPLPILPPASRVAVEMEISRDFPVDSGLMTGVRERNNGPFRSDLFLILETAWAAGAAAGIGRLARQRAAMKRLVSRAAAVGDAFLIGEAGRVAAAMGITPAPLLLTCENLDVPLACGVRKPSVILPSDFGARVQGAALRGILRHEMAHVARRDNLTGAVVRLTAAVFWFAPLIRLAMKRMRELREMACDEAAVAGEPDPLIYARALIDLARSRANPYPVPGIVDGRDGFRGLRNRVAGIIDTCHSRKDAMKHKKLSSAILIAGLLVFSLPLSGARPVPADMGKAVGVSAELPAFRWPLRIAGEEGKPGDFRITLPFGNTDNPITKKPYHHDGIDITLVKAKSSKVKRIEVVAAADGRVIEAGFDDARGNYIRIGHAGNTETLYSKLAGSAAARIGDSVTAGQFLGFMGSTGVSTGPHLHFELHIDGEPVNPLDYTSMP